MTLTRVCKPPWRHVGHGVNAALRNGDEVTIAFLNVDLHWLKPREREEVVRLIATAPQMLAALAAVVAQFDENGSADADAIEPCRAAIAAALGDEPAASAPRGGSDV